MALGGSKSAATLARIFREKALASQPTLLNSAAIIAALNNNTATQDQIQQLSTFLTQAHNKLQFAISQDGEGYEYIYAVTDSETFFEDNPNALPDDEWGFDQPQKIELSSGGFGLSFSLTWHDNQQRVDDVNRYLWLARRPIYTNAKKGDAIEDGWEPPYVVIEWGSSDTSEGVPGADGTGIEYIYAVTVNDSVAPPAPDNDWGYDQPEEPWMDNAPSLTPDLTVLWRTERKTIGAPDAGDEVAGVWSGAAVNGRWGRDGEPGEGADGVDGVGIEFIYTLTADDITPPPVPDNSWGFDSPVTPWFDAAQSLTAELPVLWRAERRTFGAPEVGDEVLGAWSAAAVYGRYAEDGLPGVGEDGEDGVGVEFIYSRTANEDVAPSAPNNEWGYDAPQGAWSDGLLSLSVDNKVSWRAERKVEGTPDAGDDVDDEWSSPVIFSRFGGDGEPGIGIEYVFAVTSNTPLAVGQYPSNSWGYEEPGSVQGLEWTDGGTDVTEDNKYQFRSQRSVTADTLSGGTVEAVWTTPALVSVFGEKGDKGEKGTGYESVYTRTNSDEVPEDLPDNGWGYNQPQDIWQGGPPTLNEDNQVLWRSDRRTFGRPGTGDDVDDNFTTPVIVGRYGTSGIDGIDGNDGAHGLPGAGYIVTYNKHGRLTEAGGWIICPQFTEVAELSWEVLTSSQGLELHGNFQTSDATDISEYVDEIKVGDFVTLYESPRRWIQYRVVNSVAFLDSPRWYLNIAYLVHDDFDGDQDLVQDSNEEFQFRYSRGVAVSGNDGTDGIGYEYIYARTADEDTEPLPPHNAWGFDEPVAPWTDAAPSLTAELTVLWRVDRRVIGAPEVGDVVPAEWTDPAIHGRFGVDGEPGEGEDGVDGIGVEYIFARTSDGDAPPSAPSNDWGFDQPALPWRDGALSLDGNNKVLWRAERKAAGAPDVGADIPDDWSNPVIVGRFGEDGTGNDGAAGPITGTERVYALTATNLLPASQLPNNVWGYKQPLISGHLNWVSDPPSITSEFRYLWRALRVWVVPAAQGMPDEGDPIADNFTPPTLLSYFAQDGEDAEDGVGYEYVYASTTDTGTVTLPDNEWGYDQPQEPWQDDAEGLLTGDNTVLFRAQRKVVGSPAIGTEVPDEWTTPSVVGGVGPAGAAGAAGESAESQYLPWSHGIPYDFRVGLAGAINSNGDWALETADGLVTTADFNWNDITHVHFYSQDETGAEHPFLFGAKEFDEGGQIIGIRREVAGEVDIIALETLGAVEGLSQSGAVRYRFAVKRYPELDAGNLPTFPINSERSAILLLPALNTGLATFRNRSTGWFWARVDAQLAATLGNIQSTDDWPTLAEAAATRATPGGPKPGDIVSLYRAGSLTPQARFYNLDSEKWEHFEGFVGGNLVVNGGIAGEHLQVGSVAADIIAIGGVDGTHIQEGSVRARHVEVESLTGDRFAVNTITVNKLAADVGTIFNLDGNVLNFDTANITGTLTAERVSSDVLNVVQLWSGSLTVAPGSGYTTYELVYRAGENWNDFRNLIAFAFLDGTSNERNHLPLFTINLSDIPTNTSTNPYRYWGGAISPSETQSADLRIYTNASRTILYMRQAIGHDGATITSIYGVR